MKQEPPQHMIDMSNPGDWEKFGSYFLFVVCIGSMLVALAHSGNDKEFAGLLFCGGMLALIASIMLFDRYKRETA